MRAVRLFLATVTVTAGLVSAAPASAVLDGGRCDGDLDYNCWYKIGTLTEWCDVWSDLRGGCTVDVRMPSGG